MLFLTGSIIGSFLNVCIYRIPRNKSIVFPASSCPYCNTKIRWFDNIPVISFALLKGRCRFCNEKISIIYPIVEFLTGSIFIMLYMRYSLTTQFFLYVLLMCFLIAAMFIDLEHQILPDEITYSIIVIGLVLSFFTSNKIIDSLLGILICGGIFYLIVVVSRGGMGGGDVKLAAGIGSFLGYKFGIVGLMLAFILGGLVGVFLLLTGIKGRKDPIPFGPFMVIGTFGVILFNDLPNVLFPFGIK